MIKFQVSFSNFNIIVQNHLCEANDFSTTYYAGSGGKLALYMGNGHLTPDMVIASSSLDKVPF
jgi:hypothetical protein